MPPSPQILESAGEKYALIIGVDQFRDSNIPALRYAKNDATAVRDFLIHPDLGRFQRENVHVLLDEEATWGDIRSQFVYWLGAKVREEDHVWIYFAGYGTTAPAAVRTNAPAYMNYLIAHDTNPNELDLSGISLEQLDEWLGLVAARRLVLIFDCGFSGLGRGRTLASGKSPSQNDYAFFSAFAEERRRMALVAAGPMENAREDDEAELGLFTRILLQRMRAGLLSNYDAELTWDTLQQYLAAEVARQADLRGTAQSPVKIGGLPGDLPIFSDVPQARANTTGVVVIPKPERVKQLLNEAQQEIYADNLLRARALLLEIVELDATNRRAINGLRKLEEVLQKGELEAQIKQAFTEARRYWDERDYTEAARWYGKVLELDPMSESARVGVEACQTILLKHEEESAPNGALVSARTATEKTVHAPKLEAYDEFIWPYIGWWALVGAVWGLFGTHTEEASTAATFITVVKFGIFGSLIGLIHASAVYFYKLTQLRLKAKKVRKT